MALISSVYVGSFGTSIAGLFGLRVTSHARTPQENASVGGAAGSDHLTGFAVDLAGGEGAMAALASWAQQNTGPGKLFRWVGWGDAGHRDHVHLSFNQDVDQRFADQQLKAAGAFVQANQQFSGFGGSAPAKASGQVEAAEPPPAAASEPQPAVQEGEVAAPGSALGVRLDPNASDEEIDAFIRRHYGYLAGFMDIPDVRATLLNAARQGFDPARLQGAISATDWWKRTSLSDREWQVIINTDPATAKQKLEDMLNTVFEVSKRLGVATKPGEGLSPEKAWEIADKAIRYGWSPQQIQKAILAESVYNPSRGEMATITDRLQLVARSYGMDRLLNMQVLEKWTRQILEGTATEDTFRAYVAEEAEKRFPWMSKYIEQGFTPRDYFQPHIQLIAQTLEMNPQDIDPFNDPRYMSVLEIHDPDTKELRGMTLREAAEWARSQPEFRKTLGANQQAAEFAEMLGQTFGAV